jgi:hypothetical protein
VLGLGAVAAVAGSRPEGGRRAAWVRLRLLSPLRVRLAHLPDASVDAVPAGNAVCRDESAAVGNYQYSPNGLGILLDQLWVR